MNKKNVGVLVLAAVLLGVTLFVFFHDNGSEDKRLSKDEQQGIRLLKTAQEICLAGERIKTQTGVDISTDLISKLKAGVGIEKDKAKGAVNYLDDQVRLIADDKIRNCLQQHMPQIQACLMGNCSTAALPKNIDFQFTYQPSDENNNLEKDRVAFNLENRSNARFLVLQPAGHYEDTIELMDQGKTRNAAIYSVVRQTYAAAADKSTRLCLERLSGPLPTDSTHTKFICEQVKGCQHDGTSPKWFALCGARGGQADFHIPFIKSAFADQGYHVWVVPSLEKLNERKQSGDLIGIGYTHFTLASLSPVEVDADAFYYDLSVNGREIHVNGLAGSFNAKSHNFSRSLVIEFALQNLDFSGANNGCDSLVLTLHFLKNEKVVGKPITIERSYVALRDARVKEFQRSGVTYRWSGKYIRAPREYDTEVFVISILVSRDLDFRTNQQGIERAKHIVSTMKTEFDRLGLVFQGRPLVAVIRPPLTQTSYGLAIGMVEETQQIRFTYKNETARQLQQFLLAQRSKGVNFKGVIKPDTFLYSIRGDASYMASPPVCRDDST